MDTEGSSSQNISSAANVIPYKNISLVFIFFLLKKLIIVCFFRNKQSTSDTANISATNTSPSHLDIIIEVERLEKILQHVNHTKRLIYIRESNKIIRQNKWQFDPVDSLIGFGRPQ